MAELALCRLDYFRIEVAGSITWGCKQCGSFVWYRQLHDDVCPGLARYSSPEELGASREKYVD